MDLEQFINKYKPFNVNVLYNEYKINYNNITDYINYDCYDIEEENIIDKEEILKTGIMYELIVYPDNAIGSYRICSSRLDLAIKEMSSLFEYLIDEGRYKIEKEEN
jgi:hypothetical protein